MNTRLLAASFLVAVVAMAYAQETEGFSPEITDLNVKDVSYAL